MFHWEFYNRISIIKVWRRKIRASVLEFFNDGKSQPWNCAWNMYFHASRPLIKSFLAQSTTIKSSDICALKILIEISEIWKQIQLLFEFPKKQTWNFCSSFWSWLDLSLPEIRAKKVWIIPFAQMALKPEDWLQDFKMLMLADVLLILLLSWIRSTDAMT